MQKMIQIGLSAVAACLIAGGVAAQPTIDGVPVDRVGDSNPRYGQATNDDHAEMPVTDLLNALSARGYARYDRIERFGQVYRVHAMTTDFRDVVVEVDTVTGQIREVQ